MHEPAVLPPQAIPAAAAGTFAGHAAAEFAVKGLGLAGFDITHLSVVGKGYHTDKHVFGFCSRGDRVHFWGTRGLFWGGLWGLFGGGVFVTVPVVGPVLALGHLGAMIATGLEGEPVAGGASALSLALGGLGIPRDSVIQYETAIAADNFLVLVHDAPARIEVARAILEYAGALRVDVHVGLGPQGVLPEAA